MLNNELNYSVSSRLILNLSDLISMANQWDAHFMVSRIPNSKFSRSLQPFGTSFVGEFVNVFLP